MSNNRQISPDTFDPNWQQRPTDRDSRNSRLGAWLSSMGFYVEAVRPEPIPEGKEREDCIDHLIVSCEFPDRLRRFLDGHHARVAMLKSLTPEQDLALWRKETREFIDRGLLTVEEVVRGDELRAKDGLPPLYPPDLPEGIQAEPDEQSPFRKSTNPVTR
jgi:hypothetical protein